MSNNDREGAAQPRILTANVPLPAKFDIGGPNMDAAWKRFQRSWNNYEVASRLNTQDTAYRTAVFLSCLGEGALDVYDEFQFGDGQNRQDIEHVIQKFTTYCVGDTCEVYETYKFHQRVQNKGETIDAYVGALRQLAKSCNFGEFQDRAIRDKLVAGIHDDSVRQKLLQEKNLTLATCIDICRVHEVSAQQARSMAADEIHTVSDRSQKKNKGRKGEVKLVSDCRYCGGSHQKGKDNCPANEKVCKNCGRKNHFAKVCKQSKAHKKKRQNKLHAVCVDSDSESDDHDDYVLTVSLAGNESQNNVKCNSIDDSNDASLAGGDECVCYSVSCHDNAVFANMCVGGKCIPFQLDSGATINSMSLDTYKSVTGDQTMKGLDKTDKKLLMYDKTKVQPIGEKIMKVRNPRNDKQYKVRFLVVDGNVRSILGCRAIQHMQLITVHTENIAQISEEKQAILSEFSEVFQGELGKLEGKLHLVTDSSIPPVKLPCRKWPIAVKEKVKSEMDRLEGLGVIKPVNEPTDWISSLVVTMKPNGEARLCIDPKPLNKALKRNDYPMKTIDDALEEMKGARFFTHFDARNGFWHVELDDESSLLTTFETPFGKYKWLRLPFGVSVAPEEFQRRIDEATKDVPGSFGVHDDFIIWGKGDTDEEAARDHDNNVRSFLHRCRERGIKLHQGKVTYKKKELPYLGHIISAEGLKADPKKIDAIKNMEAPTDRAGVQRLLGMIAYLQKFAPHLSDLAVPLRDLIKEGNNFRWDKHLHGVALEDIKKALSTPPVLKFFDPKSDVVLQCDASDYGLGASLLNDGQPVHYASRALTATERNYAQIEKEMLAIVFGLERFERFVFGRHITVQTDHKPLIPIHKKSLLSAPKRLQRMLLRTQKYDYTVVYKKGTELFLADTLSRAVKPGQAGGQADKKEEIFQTELDREIEAIDMTSHVAVSPSRQEELQAATAEDKSMQQLMRLVLEGWPDQRSQVPLELQPYYPFCEELAVQNGLIFKGDRIVVPEKKRTKILHLLHQAHTGLQGCLRRARETVYWPGLNADMEKLVGQCETCQTFQSAQAKEPMISHPIPERPWQYLACDMFEFHGKNYIVLVDYYSDFFEVDRLETKTAEEVIGKLKPHFARHGIPERMVTDNGPPFNSEKFKQFSETWDFDHVTSSPHYPQSNGKAENAVKQAKTLMKKARESETDPYLALLELRNIPSETMKTSPCQRLFSRRTRTKLPTAKTLLNPQKCSNVQEKLMNRKRKQAQAYNKNAVELTTLKPGQTVRVKFGKQWVKAKIEDQVDVRSYKLHTEDGKEYRRNRRHIRPTQETLCRPVQSGIPRITKQANNQQMARDRNNQTDRPVSKDGENCTNSGSPQQTDTNQTDKHQLQASKSKHQTPVKTGTVMQETDKQNKQAACTSRGRVVKRPSYLKDYET